MVVGCEDPQPSVSSLGKKLPAPVLKGSSPFDQDLGAQSYVRVQGTCDSRVGNIFISFDKVSWQQPPTAPDITGTTLTAATTNDRDCADGAFDVYLTKNDLTSIWGLNTDSNGSKPQYVYIKGETLIGDTETLAIANNNNSTPAKLILEKTWPWGYAGTDMCSQFNVRVVDSSGRHAQATSNITFNIAETNAGTSTNISAYTNWSDCEAQRPAQSTFTIPANSDSISVIYRFPTGPLNSTLQYLITNQSSLSVDSSASVTLRDSSATSTYRWLTPEEYIPQIYKKLCYPLKIRSYKYDRNSTSDTISATIAYSTSATNQLKFYSDPNCSAESSTTSFPSGFSQDIKYISYSPSGTESNSFITIDISYTVTATGLTYDSSPIKLTIDLTDKAIATKFDIWGPYYLDRNICTAYKILTMNDSGTLLPVSASTSINLAAKDSTGNPGGGLFYNDSNCVYTTTSSYIPASASSSIVYFKASKDAPAGSYQFNLSALGLTTKPQDFKVNASPTQFKITQGSPSLGSSCVPFFVGLSDTFGNTYTAPFQMGTTFSVAYSSTPTSSPLYSDANCTNSYSGNSLAISSGTPNTVIYVNTADLSGINFNLVVDPKNNLDGDTITVQY